MNLIPFRLRKKRSEMVCDDFLYGCEKADTFRRKLHLDGYGFPDFYFGLYHALQRYYISKGISPLVISDSFVWSEVGPFVLMEERMAIECLIDFVKYLEGKESVDIDQLRFLINHAIINCPDAESNGYLFIANAVREISPEMRAVGWLDLLNQESGNKIKELLEGVDELRLHMIA